MATEAQRLSIGQRRLIKAVCYIRMSKDGQEKSPDQQRAELIEFADSNGYEIAHWYDDLGISGDSTEKRKGFQQMVADGAAGEFEAILCWDQDRFGRFDLIEAGKWIHPLREAGVNLATVTGGVTDWNNLVDQLSYMAKQVGKHQFLTDLSTI